MSNIYPPGAELAGRYRILGLSASVGIGSLFEAERLVGQGRVAFKWLRFPNASRQVSLDDLVLRARAARLFSHPGALPPYEVVREGSSVFVVSELVRGEPLLTRLSPHLLRPAERLDVLLQAMRTVAAAHACGVVHGGVHPGNLFLEQPGDGGATVAKVLDFVTSHFAALGLGASNIPLGRAVYRDREQLCGGSELDVRADVFSFGVLTYQALTGRLPYYGENAIDLAGRLLTSVLTPVAALRPEASGALDRALSAALVVSRERRPSSLQELIEALSSFSAYMGVSAAPARTEAGTALMVVQRSEAGVATVRALRAVHTVADAHEPSAAVTQLIPVSRRAPSQSRAATPSRADVPGRNGSSRWITRLALASSLAAVAAVALYVGSLSLGDAERPPKVRAAVTHAREPGQARTQVRESLAVNSRPERVRAEHQEQPQSPERAWPQPASRVAEPRVEELSPTPASAPAALAPALRAEKRRRLPLERPRAKGRKGVTPDDSPFRAGLPPEVGEF